MFFQKKNYPSSKTNTFPTTAPYLTKRQNLNKQLRINIMKNQISETDFNTAIHSFSDVFLNRDINLGEETLMKLNEAIEAFLTEETAIKVVPDAELADDSKILIEKERLINCSAKEFIHYEVDKAEWNNLLDELGDEEEALTELQRQLKVKRIDYEAEVHGEEEEIEVSVQEI